MRSFINNLIIIILPSQVGHWCRQQELTVQWFGGQHHGLIILRLQVRTLKDIWCKTIKSFKSAHRKENTRSAQSVGKTQLPQQTLAKYVANRSKSIFIIQIKVQQKHVRGGTSHFIQFLFIYSSQETSFSLVRAHLCR